MRFLYRSIAMYKHTRKFLVWIFFILASQTFLHANSNTTNFTERACETHFKPGDIMIGGMFSIYGMTNTPCDGDFNEFAISLLESMTYAVDLINKRDDVLANLTLGYEIRNDCGSEDIALWTMLTMTGPSRMADYAATCPNHSREKADQVLAVIGTDRSATSLLAAKVGRLYAVPIISYYATSDEFSDTGRFPFFFRTVPPDKFQVGAIIDLLDHYNWRYIALFYSIDSYGIHGARQIRSLAEKRDICIPINMPVSGEPSDSEISEIRGRLKESDKVSVIVLFADTLPALAVHRAIKGMNKSYTFIGSDGWGPDKNDFDDISPGLYGLYIQFSSVSKSIFQDYYNRLPLDTDHASQWYRDYLNQLNIHNCTGEDTCRNPTPHNVSEQVIDGVMAIAYALDASIHDTCDNNGRCADALNGRNTKENLHRVSFTPPGSNRSFQFDNNGEVSGKYKLQNWQFNDGVHEMVTVGLWDQSNAVTPLSLTEKLIQWGTRNGKVPRSLCIEDCKPGYVRVPIEKNCCLGCQRCPEFAIVVTQNKTSSAMCLECPITHWPDDNFIECLQINPTYIDTQSMVYIVSSTVAGGGLILTAITAIGLCYYSQHSLIKASSRELSCINIIGLAFSCLVVFIILLRPSSVTCVVVDVCISTCVCMTFVPMLLKVNRIWRIFNATKGKRPRYTSPGHQLSIAATLIIVEVLIACSSIFFASSKPSIMFPVQRKPYLEIFCQLSHGFLASCAYNMTIIIACCYFAFRARKVPSNYNESKFIGISVYSTVIVYLAAVPVYTTSIDVAQKILTLIVALLFNTYLTLACLYLPKIYAIHFASDDAQQSWRTRELGSTPQASPYEKSATELTTATAVSASAPQSCSPVFLVISNDG